MKIYIYKNHTMLERKVKFVSMSARSFDPKHNAEMHYNILVTKICLAFGLENTMKYPLVAALETKAIVSLILKLQQPALAREGKI